MPKTPSWIASFTGRWPRRCIPASPTTKRMAEPKTRRQLHVIHLLHDFLLNVRFLVYERRVQRCHRGHARTTDRNGRNRRPDLELAHPPAPSVGRERLKP